jgi:hypothetical protein
MGSEVMNRWVAQHDQTALAAWLEGTFASSTAPSLRGIRSLCDGDALFGFWLLHADVGIRRESGLGVWQFSKWDWHGDYLNDLSPYRSAQRAAAALPDVRHTGPLPPLPAPPLPKIPRTSPEEGMSSERHSVATRGWWALSMARLRRWFVGREEVRG